MKKLITFGVFDYFHIGHLNLFENSKKYGDYLIVAIQDDKSVLKYKPDANMFYSTTQRQHLINSLKQVNETVIYNDVDEDIKKFDFDVFIVGEEQNHRGFKNAIKWCEDNNKEVVIINRTKNISSSKIKEKVENLK